MSTKYRVFLDPDGTIGHLLGVVVRSDTGVVYVHECAGLLTEEREAEGFFVPVGGLKIDPDEGSISVAAIAKVFHDSGACGSGRPMSSEWLAVLRTAVANVTFWTDAERRSHLRLDEQDPTQILEGWIPVLTELGAGVLVFTNCD